MEKTFQGIVYATASNNSERLWDSDQTEGFAQQLEITDRVKKT